MILAKKTEDRKKGSRRILCVLVWIGLWQLAAVLIHSSIIFSGPFETAKALLSLLPTWGFWESVFSSSLRIILGFLGAFFLASLIGTASFFLPSLCEFLSPAVLLMKSIPVASFVILALIWIGSENLSVFISFTVVFPMIYEAALSGLAGADSSLLEMADVFHLPWLRRLKAIYLPSLLPYLAGSCRTAIGMGIKSGVAAEVIGIPAHSIGEQLYTAKIYLETADLFAWTAVIIVITWLLEQSLLILLRIYFEKSAERQIKNPAVTTDQITTEKLKHKFWRDRPGAIAVQNLYRSYEKQQVLSGVSLSIKPSEICCLMAPSGSGKTTLFRILLSLEKADRGSVSIPPRLGAVFQENRLIEHLSPVENIRLVLPSASRAELCGYLITVLTELLPNESLNRPVSTLSGGMKRRCALARALLSHSDALILDEPFSGLDVDTKRQTIAFIKKHQRGRALLLSTHSEEDAVLLGAKITTL